MTPPLAPPPAQPSPHTPPLASGFCLSGALTAVDFAEAMLSFPTALTEQGKLLKAFAYVDAWIICFTAASGTFSQGTSVLSLDPATGELSWLGDFPSGIQYFDGFFSGTSVGTSYYAANAYRLTCRAAAEGLQPAEMGKSAYTAVESLLSATAASS